MKRRKAIAGILLGGVGIAGAFGGYKWYNWRKEPDFAYLERSLDLIAALSETIIPETDSPGARSAGVQDVIILLIRDCTDRKTTNTFIDGLKQVQEYCYGTYAKRYEQCSIKEQEAALRHFEQKVFPLKGKLEKVRSRYWGKSFFSILKEYVVKAYCTSEVGATQGLAYLYIPGRYEGCIPLQPDQKAWATN